MKKTLVLLAALVAFTGSAFGQQYYNISPKYIYEHQVMDSTHAGVISVDTLLFNKTAATKDVNLYRSSANRLRTGDSLTVDGNLTVTGTSTHTGIASFANGTAALPSVVGINDANTGIRFGGTDTLSFVANGADRMTILGASGNIGIGTTSPATMLHVKQSTTDGTALYLETTSTSTISGGAGALVLGNNDQTASSTNGMRCNFTNNSGGVAQAGGMYVGKEGLWTSTAATNDSYLAFGTTLDQSIAEKVRISSTGSVGIATTTPSTAGKLSVAGGVTIGVATTDTVLNAHQLRINDGATYSEIVAGETAFANSSDESMKDNIQPVNTDSIYALVRAMKYPRKWQYKASAIRTQAEVDRINQATSDAVVTPIVQARIDSLIKAKATGTFTVDVVQVPVVTYKKEIASIEPSYVRVGLDSLDEAIVVPADTTYQDVPETTYVARYDTIYTCSASKRAEIQNAVLGAQEAKAASELADYNERIAVSASRPHVSVMAQDMYPVSRLMKGAAAKQTTLSGDDLINALLISIKKQAEEIEDLKNRVSKLEAK